MSDHDGEVAGASLQAPGASQTGRDRSMERLHCPKDREGRDEIRAREGGKQAAQGLPRQQPEDEPI